MNTQLELIEGGQSGENVMDGFDLSGFSGDLQKIVRYLIEDKLLQSQENINDFYLTLCYLLKEGKNENFINRLFHSLRSLLKKTIDLQSCLKSCGLDKNTDVRTLIRNGLVIKESAESVIEKITEETGDTLLQEV